MLNTKSNRQKIYDAINNWVPAEGLVVKCKGPDAWQEAEMFEIDMKNPHFHAVDKVKYPTGLTFDLDKEIRRYKKAVTQEIEANYVEYEEFLYKRKYILQLEKFNVNFATHPEYHINKSDDNDKIYFQAVSMNTFLDYYNKMIKNKEKAQDYYNYVLNIFKNDYKEIDIKHSENITSTADIISSFLPYDEWIENEDVGDSEIELNVIEPHTFTEPTDPHQIKFLNEILNGDK